MKKLFFIPVFLLICSSAFAAQSASLSEVLSWKYGQIADTCQKSKDSSQMVICGWRSEEPQPSEAETEVITQQYYDSQDYWVARFDIKIFMPTMYTALSPESQLKLSPYTGALTSLIEFKNFLGIKQLLYGLVAQETMTSEEQTIIYQCFLDQGIDLTLWS